MDDNLKKLQCLNKKYCKMVNDVLQLRFVIFSSSKNPRFDYAKQMSISSARIDLATACMIHYGLNHGMIIHNLKDEYVGESLDV
jgi:hypothetical protein